MKTKVMKKTAKENTKCHKWLWLALAFVLGCCVGGTTYYLVTNWNNFFVMCPDGVRPDKNGCCAGEVYTDAGNGWMVCCPDGGDNCFPPMK
ncbi:MAG: hypothetical protein IKF41_04075 [Alphaproteobacteria bacterium]|nr:hypothetical protein [Alphaproteobacteria bacterium]